MLKTENPTEISEKKKIKHIAYEKDLELLVKSHCQQDKGTVTIN